MKELSQSYLKYLFDYADGKLVRIVNRSSTAVVGDAVGYKNSDGYLMVRIDDCFYMVHRLIWIYHNCYIPTGLQIDHIDGDKINNKIENLRCITQIENLQHKYDRLSNSYSSVYKGVSWDKTRRKWKAAVVINKKRIVLGRFVNELDARDAAFAARLVRDSSKGSK